MIVSRAAILAAAFALLAGGPAFAQAPEGGPAGAAPGATLPQPPPLAPGAPIPGQALGSGGLPPGAVVVPQNTVPPGAVIVQQGGGKPPPPRELTPAEIQALQREMTARGAAAILTPGNIGEIRDRVLDAQGAST